MSALQWSRELSLAETQIRPTILGAIDVLQWSRELSLAETNCGHCRMLEPRRRFNGAASSHSRKRAEAGAEYAAPGGASMEPRALTRGNGGQWKPWIIKELRSAFRVMCPETSRTMLK